MASDGLRDSHGIHFAFCKLVVYTEMFRCMALHWWDESLPSSYIFTICCIQFFCVADCYCICGPVWLCTPVCLAEYQSLTSYNQSICLSDVAWSGGVDC